MKNDRLKNLPADIQKDLDPTKQRLFQLSCEKECSSWITALPTAKHGFDLHKSAFRDALCLHYCWQLTNLPDTCACGNKFVLTMPWSRSAGAIMVDTPPSGTVK